MTEIESNLTFTEPSSKKSNTLMNKYKVSLSDMIYQVAISKDGDQWCALIGHSLQDGISGFGDSITAALHELADKIDQN